MTREVSLSRLDGASPLDLLTTLGLMRVIEERDSGVRLTWSPEGNWRPCFYSSIELDCTTVFDWVARDAHEWQSARLLQFWYPKKEKRGVKRFAGLKPPIPILREWLRQRLAEGDERSIEYASALMCQGAVDTLAPDRTVSFGDAEAFGAVFDSGSDMQVARQTPFDFTCRNTQFIDQVRDIAASLSGRRVEGELMGKRAIGGVQRMDWEPLRNAPAATNTKHVPSEVA